MRSVISILLLLSLSVLVYADFYNGNELYECYRICQRDDSEKSWVKSGIYIGYITGVVDAVGFETIPDGVQVGQLCEIVGRYLERHPERRHLDAALLVREAIDEAFIFKGGGKR